MRRSGRGGEDQLVMTHVLKKKEIELLGRRLKCVCDLGSNYGQTMSRHIL